MLGNIGLLSSVCTNTLHFLCGLIPVACRPLFAVNVIAKDVHSTAIRLEDVKVTSGYPTLDLVASVCATRVWCRLQ